ncbi:MAG: hypothetical protein AAB270_08840, partial [Chloroflexota bacterium]
PPLSLVLPDGNTIRLNYWNSLLIEVAQYLHSTGKLTATACPLRRSAANRYLVHTTPQHPNGKPFFAAVQVGNLYLETNQSAPGLVSNALFLIRHLDENPDAFKVGVR